MCATTTMHYTTKKMETAFNGIEQYIEQTVLTYKLLEEWIDEYRQREIEVTGVDGGIPNSKDVRSCVEWTTKIWRQFYGVVYEKPFLSDATTDEIREAEATMFQHYESCLKAYLDPQIYQSAIREEDARIEKRERRMWVVDDNVSLTEALLVFVTPGETFAPWKRLPCVCGFPRYNNYRHHHDEDEDENEKKKTRALESIMRDPSFLVYFSWLDKSGIRTQMYLHHRCFLAILSALNFYSPTPRSVGAAAD
mgnify:FL=1